MCALLLLGLGWAAGTEKEPRPPKLQSYLQRAMEEGIIDGYQVHKLQLLAISMNLNFPSSPLPAASPAPAEQSQEASLELEPQAADSPEAEATTEPQDKRTSMFMRVYNHLTLLNVLYLSGAVTIMGAYSIFMTLAVERCNYAALSGIMLVQVVLFGGVGLSVWESEEYAYAGGMYVRIKTREIIFEGQNLVHCTLIIILCNLS